MNRKKYKAIWLLAALLAAAPMAAHADEADTLRVVDVEEVVVIGTPKETDKLRRQPASVTLLSRQAMEAAGVQSIKHLTGIVPNLFIPDYGSRLTTAVYIRGIGSRINTPSVGLYVDNIPYTDKAAFDFDYSDIERIDVLRGPQGTLYGRNAMAGLIKVHTKSPFSYQGTDARMEAATYGDYRASLTHYHRISPRFAFSAGGFYKNNGGFFKEAIHGKRTGGEQGGGGRLHAVCLPAEEWKVDLNLSYEYNDQQGYPYFYLGSLEEEETPEELRPYVGKIAQNRQSSYCRSLLNGGINLEYQGRGFTLSAVTGYQFLRDRMFLDQDFTPQDIYTLVQRQRSHTLSQEVAVKSATDGRWQWVTGVSGFYQWLRTGAPVEFQPEGMSMLEGLISSVVPSRINVPMGTGMEMHILPALELTDSRLPISALFHTPVANGALFHQSTLRRLFGIEGLELTAGLRLECERQTMEYDAGCSLGYTLGVKGEMVRGGEVVREIEMMPAEALQVVSAYLGKVHKTYVQLLPKLSLQYSLPGRGGNRLYATVSKGYRSGGYNIQMFSDLLQTALQGTMQAQAKGVLLERVPEAYRELIADKLPDGSTPPDAEAAATYRPEQAWNYEAGTHLGLWGGRLQADAALFWLQTHDQQLSRFAQNGLGRETVNAGSSRSVGMEASATAAITANLTLQAGYGWTHATFRRYISYEQVEGEMQAVSYRGKRVPFVPEHTIHVGGQYAFSLRPSCWLDGVQLGVQYSGAGSIYWTEKNDARQPFYGKLDARLSLQKGEVGASFWINNALNKHYATFYFESMGNRFLQKGRPLQAGITLQLKLKG